MPRLLVALALVAPLLLAPSARAASDAPPRVLDWEYRVSLPDPGSGTVHVEVRFRGLEGIVDRMTFQTLDHRETVRLDPSHADTLLSIEPGGFSFDVDGPTESFGFEVDVRRPAFREGEYLSWAGDEFALFKAESLSLAFTYRYYEGDPFEWRSRVVLEPPAGWGALGPWEQDAEGAYVLPAGEVLPRGYIVMGPFEEPEPVEAGGKSVRYVRLGEPAAYEAQLYDYIDRATPYYEAVYGPGTGRSLVVVNAPDPMFRGGLGGANSFFVHESVDLRTVAHEYAHVFQQFGTVEQAGRAAIWLNEGDADLHGALSLLAAERWSPDDVRRAFREAEADERDLGLRDARLVDATYGTSLERFAYHKGLVVLRALDEEIARATSGAAGLSDLLRALNAAHEAGEGDAVTNDELILTASSVAGVDLAPFFERHVFGTLWPDVADFTPRGELVVSDLQVAPAAGAPGEPVTASVVVSNSGTEALERDLALRVDGVDRDTHHVRLGVGQVTIVEFGFIAPDAAGAHDVRVAYLNHTFRTLAPPSLAIDRVSVLPETVSAGDDVTILAFVRNDGELPGAGRIEILLGDALLARTEELFVNGLASEPATLKLTLRTPGEVALGVRLDANGGGDLRVAHVNVLPADRDRDGVPDEDDDYPLNPRIAQGSVVNDARDRVPFAPVAAVLLAVALVALLRRR